MFSFLPAGLMNHPSNTIRIILLLFFLPLCGRAQEGGWTFSVSGGFTAPNLSSVNGTLDRTIREWNEIRNVPITAIPHFSVTPLFGLRCSYRYDRDMSVSLSGSYSRQSVNASYRDNVVFLNLDRSVQTTNLMLGFSQSLSPLAWDMEISIVVDLGLMFAHAEAVSYNTREEKSGSETITVIDYDSKAIYRKTKLIADVGAIWTWAPFQPFFLQAEALYRFAKIGKMDGDIRRLQGTFPEQSTTDFDFSGFSATIGLGISF